MKYEITPLIKARGINAANKLLHFQPLVTLSIGKASPTEASPTGAASDREAKPSTACTES